MYFNRLDGKDIETYKMRKGLNNSSDKLYLKSFNGATTEDMKSYIIPSKTRENDLYIIHTGSNDLRTPMSPEDIANNITALAKSIKSDENEVIISSIIARNDNTELDKKGKEVNIFLNNLCTENNFGYVNNSNICSDRHLNGSRLHLNSRGTVTFAKNLLNAINL